MFFSYLILIIVQPKDSTVNKNPPFETASSVKSETSVTSSPMTTPVLLEPQKQSSSRSVTPELASTKVCAFNYNFTLLCLMFYHIY